MKKSYLETKVPICENAVWLCKLKKLCGNIPVKWQDGYYHITMAFLNDTTNEQRETARQIIDRRLKDAQPISMTFDKVDAFSVPSGDMHIINLTATKPNEVFMKLTDDIRQDLSEAGLHLDSDFLLHVTLGRVGAKDVSLEHLKDGLAALAVPNFTLNLHEYEYRIFRGETLGRWKSNK